MKLGLKEEKDWYKFNQLCAHFLHIKEMEARGGADVEGREIQVWNNFKKILIFIKWLQHNVELHYACNKKHYLLLSETDLESYTVSKKTDREGAISFAFFSRKTSLCRAGV